MVKQILRKIKHKCFPHPTTVFNSYSQAGEDRVLNFLFESMGIKKPSYIDIGANLPDWGNNTYFFYLHGSSGVCIEPDPNLFENLQKKRNRDICLNSAISFDEIEEVEFYLFGDPSLNTMSYDEAKKRHEIGTFKITNRIKVQTVQIDKVLDKYFLSLPHFISIDVEGLDFQILQSFNFEKYQIPVWVVETVQYSETHIKSKENSIIKLMHDKGYFVYADTYINTIFVLKKWFDNYLK